MVLVVLESTLAAGCGGGGGVRKFDAACVSTYGTYVSTLIPTRGLGRPSSALK